MAARQDHDFVVKSVTFELRYRIARKPRQKSHVVLRVNNEGLLGPAGKLFEIRNRTDAAPQRAQPVEVNLRFETLADVARGLPVPDHVRDVGRGMIESRHANAGIVRGGKK